MTAGRDRDVEVAIVGAGAVGLLLACLLARRGLEVVVLERRATVGSRTRAIGIHPPGLAALDAVGAGPAVRREAAVVREGVATCEAAEIARVRFRGEPVFTLPQHRTEALLTDRLEALAPGAVQRNAVVTGVRPSPEYVDVELADGGGVRARYVVGADGIRSTVRELIGTDWNWRRGAADYVMADATWSAEDPETAMIHLEPRGVVESFPLPGRGRRWVVRLDRPAAHDSAAHGATVHGAAVHEAAVHGAAVHDADGFARLVEDRIGVRLDPSTLAEPSAFRARQNIAGSFARGRIALVGDAAHEVSPIGGQGMNLGWIDAVHLDRAIALAEGDPAPFARYARMRRAAAERATRQAGFNMAMGAPYTGGSLRARNAFLRALAAPPTRGLLAGAFTMRWL